MTRIAQLNSPKLRPMEGAIGGDTDDEKATARALEALTRVLERMVERNDKIPQEAEEKWPQEGEEESATGRQRRRRRRRGLAAFRGARAPGMSVAKYLERIQRYTGCPASCFVVAFVYIDRAAHRHPGSPVMSLNVHRLLLASVLVASKVLDDMHHNNAFFAKVGGVSNAELNRLELELLLLLDFEVMVTSRVYEIYFSHLEKESMILANQHKPDKSISTVADVLGEIGDVDAEETLDMDSPQMRPPTTSTPPSRRSVEW